MATEPYFLSIQGSVQGQYNECVQCFQSAGLVSNDTASAGENLIQAWNAHLKTAWLSMLPQSYFLDLVTARRAFPKPSVVSHVQFPAFTVPGMFGVNACAYNLCPCVFLVPVMGTKSGGRTFLPCAPAGQLVNNAYQAGYSAQVQAYFTTAISGAAGSGTNWQLSIYSRKLQVASYVAAVTQSTRLGFQGKRRTPMGSA